MAERMGEKTKERTIRQIALWLVDIRIVQRGKGVEWNGAERKVWKSERLTEDNGAKGRKSVREWDKEWRRENGVTGTGRRRRDSEEHKYRGLENQSQTVWVKWKDRKKAWGGAIEGLREGERIKGKIVWAGCRGQAILLLSLRGLCSVSFLLSLLILFKHSLPTLCLYPLPPSLTTITIISFKRTQIPSLICISLISEWR